MKQFVTRIITNNRIADQYYEITFPWEEKESIPMPGQFFSLRVARHTDPLLRRPFAFSGYNSLTRLAAMIYQVRGKATLLLAEKKAGEELDIAGPFGNWFMEPEDEGRMHGEQVQKHGPAMNFLIAGGIGLGPMLFFARRLQEQARPFHFIYGCRQTAQIPDSALFQGINPEICTDDGSAGYKGTAVDYLRAQPESILMAAAIYSCGPYLMQKGCHLFAETRGIPCWVSMEAMMACSVGACMGCVIRVEGEARYVRVCKEGPVFKSRDIIWD